MASKNSTSGLKCFLLNDCQFKNAKEKPAILKFSHKSFEKCRKALHVRNVLRIKYQKVNLNSVHVNVYGYHSVCYKNFTALSKKHIEKSETVKPFPARSRSNSPMLGDGQNKAGINKSASPTSRMTYHSAEMLEDVNAEIKKEPTDQIEDQIAVNPVVINDELENNVLNGNGGQVVKTNCVFCGKFRKQTSGRDRKISVSKQSKLKETIRVNASKKQDQIMSDYLDTLNDDDPVYYHMPCKNRYYKAYTLAPTKAEHGAWHISREIYNRVFSEIYAMVSETVIENRQFLLLQDLLISAWVMLEQEYNDAFGSFDRLIHFTAHKLQTKLLARFPSEIKIFTSVKEKMKVVASADSSELPDEEEENSNRTQT